MRILYENNIPLKYHSEEFAYRAEFCYDFNNENNQRFGLGNYFLMGVHRAKLYSKYHATVAVNEYQKIDGGISNFKTIRTHCIRITAQLDKLDYNFLKIIAELKLGHTVTHPYEHRVMSLSGTPEDFFTKDILDGQSHIRLDEGI